MARASKFFRSATIRHHLARGSLALLATGCATQRVYTLPPKVASQAEYAADPLVACATLRNYQAERDGYLVKVYYSDDTTAQFNLDPYTNQTMALSVDDRQLTPAQAERAFDKIKTKSEELFACATNPSAYTAEATDGPTSPETALMMASSMGDVSPVGDSCANLSACYADITANVCHGNDADCRSHYTMSDDTAADPAKCHQTLQNIPNMMRELQAQRPGFLIPSSCSTEQSTDGPKPPLSQGAATTTAASETAAQIASFEGTWTAHLSYTYSCGNAAEQAYEGKDEGTWTLQVSGPVNDLRAQVSSGPAAYRLSGSGGEAGLRLCGAFPLRGKAQLTASPQVNNVCLIFDPQTASNTLKGRMEGAYYVAEQSCAVGDASVELQRQP
jgi:hypothetical protein